MLFCAFSSSLFYSSPLRGNGSFLQIPLWCVLTPVFWEPTPYSMTGVCISASVFFRTRACINTRILNAWVHEGEWVLCRLLPWALVAKTVTNRILGSAGLCYHAWLTVNLASKTQVEVLLTAMLSRQSQCLGQYSSAVSATSKTHLCASIKYCFSVVLKTFLYFPQ